MCMVDLLLYVEMDFMFLCIPWNSVRNPRLCCVNKLEKSFCWKCTGSRSCEMCLSGSFILFQVLCHLQSILVVIYQVCVGR